MLSTMRLYWSFNYLFFLGDSAVLVSLVYFFENFQIKTYVECYHSYIKRSQLCWYFLWFSSVTISKTNFFVMSVQLLYKALSDLLLFFMFFFFSVISSKPNFIAVLITVSQFLVGFSCFSSVTVCTINYDIRQYLFFVSSSEFSYFTGFL